MVNIYPAIRKFPVTRRIPSLSVFGRSLLLITLELAANVLCWAIIARSHAILGLAILAWTFGLRHVKLLLNPRPSAIDNATRTLISHGRLSITCGLFFSLGHSTIVIVVNVAIVISSNVYTKMTSVGNVGSIVGTAISASFLFIIGLANSVILWRILHQRYRTKRKTVGENGDTPPEPPQNENMLMLRLLGPLVNYVDRPWKMYPVGVLFGLGFDTASSIAVLSISALAKDTEGETKVAPSEVVILPLLFTAGMTLVDSLDSILMLYSYSGLADHSWRIFEAPNFHLTVPNAEATHSPEAMTVDPSPQETNDVAVHPLDRSSDSPGTHDKSLDNTTHENKRAATDSDRMTQIKRRTMTKLSITLTIMSILLAFSISLIDILGLIGATCAKCQAAADAPDGGGLAGKWWRAWAAANNNIGYIGIAIVGVFIIVVGGWYMTGWGAKVIKRKAAQG